MIWKFLWLENMNSLDSAAWCHLEDEIDIRDLIFNSFNQQEPELWMEEPLPAGHTLLWDGILHSSANTGNLNKGWTENNYIQWFMKYQN